MTILKLFSERPGPLYINVNLLYDDIRDITNGLYEAQKINPDFQEIFTKCKFLFDLVKEGMIQPETVDRFEQIYKDKQKQSKANK